MKYNRTFSSFNIQLNMDHILSSVDCSEKNPSYSQAIKLYPELEKVFFEKISPKAFLCTDALSSAFNLPNYTGQPIMCCVLTLGSEIDLLIHNYFDLGELFSALIINAMADEYIFQMDKNIQALIPAECNNIGFGILKRLEVGTSIPLQTQQLVASTIKQNIPLANISVNESFMLTPEKTMSYILVLSENTNICNCQHDCSGCTSKTCTHNSVTVECFTTSEHFILNCTRGTTIWDNLAKSHFFLGSFCGGKGICGKCRIQVLKGNIDITEFDRKFFSSEELNNGFRLACKSLPSENCSIYIDMSTEKGFEILTNAFQKNIETTEIDSSFYIAIDIGTTTLAFELIGVKTKKIYEVFSDVNKQIIYGSDVISRISNANGSKLFFLQKIIKEQLLNGINLLCRTASIPISSIKAVAISGNTAMLHFLLGYSCEGLALAPFKALTTSKINTTFNALFNTSISDAKIEIIPSLSAFIGGDIVSGILYCNLDLSDKINILIDLGTNGEIVIGNKDKLLTASCAAGPAFEGGHISCGMPSLPGAIYEFDLPSDTIKTISNSSPIGICGTGVIDITSELVKYKLVDNTGLFSSSYFKEGYPVAETLNGRQLYFTQNDIREIQLAKSAIRSGIETLITNMGITYNDVDKIYLSGGMGCKLDIRKASFIGLIPSELYDKVVAVGNSSLSGAYNFLFITDIESRLKKIKTISHEIILAEEKIFSKLYMKYMYF